MKQVIRETIEGLKALVQNPDLAKELETQQYVQNALKWLRYLTAMFDSENHEGRARLYINLLRELNAKHRNELALALLGTEFRDKYQSASAIPDGDLSALVEADRQRTPGDWNWSDEHTLADDKETVLADGDVYVHAGVNPDYHSILAAWPLGDNDTDESRDEMRANLKLAAAAPKLLAEVLRLRSMDPVPPTHPELEP
jgi:hypothetical protein